MKFHPIANIFPLMIDNELNGLASDIKENGLKEPITLYEEMILDGRNRFRACEIAGVKPKFKTFNNGNPLAYVLSLNLHRRHLTTSQQAAVAVNVKPFFEEEARKRELAGTKPDPMENFPQGTSRDQAAAAVGGVSGRTVDKAENIKNEAPDLFEKLITGDITVNKAEREVKKRKAQKNEKEAHKKISKEIKKSIQSVCDIRHCSMQKLLKSGIKPDVLITDPPYSEKYLSLYEDLALLSKDISVVAVMCGQSYLPEIFAMMIKHLKYRWTLAYLTPGGQSVQVWQSKINTFWKPVLLFGESSEWIGDVCKSNPNDNDKRYHGWGQSESGTADLIKRLSKPDQLVCDPFIGGGTTALVSLQLGRRFVGCDIDSDACKKTIQRVEVEYVPN